MEEDVRFLAEEPGWVKRDAVQVVESEGIEEAIVGHDEALRRWTWKQLRVARWMALGFSIAEAAGREGVSRRVVQEWIDGDDFERAVELLALRGWERLDALLWGNVELALETQREVLAGRLLVRTDRAQEARWLLERALQRAGGLGKIESRGEAERRVESSGAG